MSDPVSETNGQQRVVMRYKTTRDFEYKAQNKRGGRPMVIKIPKGSIGELINDSICFPDLRRRGHNPFVFWASAFDSVEPYA